MLHSAYKPVGNSFPRFAPFIIACVITFFALPRTVAAGALSVEVQPARVPITFGYHGAKLTVSGESAPTDDIVVKISTAPTDTHMKTISKVAGLVWMKKGGIEFKGLPLAYLLYSTADLTRILAPEELTDNGLGHDHRQSRWLD